MRHLNEMLVVLYTDTQTYTFGTTETLNNMLGSGANQLAPQIEVSQRLVSKLLDQHFRYQQRWQSRIALDRYQCQRFGSIERQISRCSLISSIRHRGKSSN